MKHNILKARIKRNGLIVNAGKHYVDETSQIVCNLKKEGKNALLGIQKKDTLYTILVENSVYYASTLGIKGVIKISDFNEILLHNAVTKGRLFGRFKYLKINNNEKIWLKNRSTMESLWNTLLWLEDLEKERKGVKPDGLL